MTPEFRFTNQVAVNADSDAETNTESDTNSGVPKTKKPLLTNREDTKQDAKPDAKAKVTENKVVRLLDKNPLGMTLPEMAGGPRQVKKIKLLRPLLSEAIKNGLVMPVSQRAGNTVYRLVKYLGPR